MRKRIDYPMGSISSGTMRMEDMIPTFVHELHWLIQHNHPTREMKKRHYALIRGIEKRMNDSDCPYFDDGDADSDLSELFDALGEYAGPYFYFGAHPGDGSDYGFWLSEDWDEDFITAHADLDRMHEGRNIKVSDLADVPSWFRGEVAVVTDHGNVALYVKTSRGLRMVWSLDADGNRIIKA